MNHDHVWELSSFSGQCFFGKTFYIKAKLWEHCWLCTVVRIPVLGGQLTGVSRRHRRPPAINSPNQRGA